MFFYKMKNKIHGRDHFSQVRGDESPNNFSSGVMKKLYWPRRFERDIACVLTLHEDEIIVHIVKLPLSEENGAERSLQTEVLDGVDHFQVGSQWLPHGTGTYVSYRGHQPVENYVNDFSVETQLALHSRIQRVQFIPDI